MVWDQDVEVYRKIKYFHLTGAKENQASEADGSFELMVLSSVTEGKLPSLPRSFN